METKKQLKAMDETVKAIKETFQRQEWIRYIELEKIKKKFPKEICFIFPKKMTLVYDVDEKQYKEWRKILDEICKTKK